MKKESSGVITFKSTHYALQAEGVLEDNDIEFKTIPTPREITYSCGLAILLDLDYTSDINKLVGDDILIIESFYKYTKGTKKPIERII